VIYTKHSSPDIYKTIDQPNINYDKYWNLCVHFAGKSWLKNTNAIIQGWIIHKIPLKLIITCRDECYKTLKTRSNKFLKKYNVIIKREINQIDKDHLLKIAGLVLCPSRCEGYGHYINEARSAGAFVLTTDHPSISELSTDLTVRCISSTERSKLTGNLLNEECNIDLQNLSQTMKAYMDMPVAQKKEICVESRKKYESDTLFLINSLRNNV
jgi:glycosyltransferase involved in cell wall biosynthesis